MIFALSTIVIVLIGLLCTSIWFNIKCAVSILEHNDKNEELADQIEQSLDILDDCYGRLTRAVETPVMSDDPVVKAFLVDMQHAKDAVLLVANKIVSFDKTDKETNE